MTQLLKQSTAATVKLGPFVDSTDGVTAETALTISQADIRLSKNGGAFAQTNNATGATHDENGYYGVPLDTTDTNTLGRLRVAVNESGALPVWQDFMVVNANVYDSLVGGSDNLQVDTVQIEGVDATNQINSEVDTALADYDAPTKAELDSGLAALNDLDAAGVRSAVGLASANLDTQLSTIDTVVDGIQTDLDNGTDGLGAIKADTAAILIDTNELQTDNVPGLIAALNDLDAAGVRSAIGLATANLDTQLDALPTAAENRAEMDSNSTQLAAIVADTNELQTDNIPGLIAALNDLSAADVNAQVDAAFTTQMADSVATDGSIATREQALYMILQFLTEFAISGTTLTVKKVDGSTTLMSFTLDDATNPTSLTRS